MHESRMSANVEMMDTSNIGDSKKELTGRARRKMSKMDKQPASMIVQEDSDARLNVSEVSPLFIVIPERYYSAG
jgi:hypothetical protein